MPQVNINISTPNDGLGDPLRSAFNNVNTMFTELYANVVFKEAGKGLSSNDYTTIEKTKLSGIATGAEVNVQADLLQEDNTQDSFVQNRFAIIPGTIPVQVQLYTGVNTFTVPVNAKVIGVLLVRTVLWENDEWTQSGTTVTINKPMTTGNRIQFNFY